MLHERTTSNGFLIYYKNFLISVVTFKWHGEKLFPKPQKKYIFLFVKPTKRYEMNFHTKHFFHENIARAKKKRKKKNSSHFVSVFLDIFFPAGECVG